ncbi:MAG: septum formation family protein [Acidimicrobiia bacterium]
MRAIALALLVVVSACGEATRGEGGTVVEEGRVSAFEVEVGDCFNDPEDLSAVVDVEAVPCQQAHDNEIFALPQYPAGPEEAYPGDEEVDSFAEQACLEAFAGYVGIPYEDSVFIYGTISPRAETWADGDREVICILYDPDQKLEGSMQGSRR